MTDDASNRHEPEELVEHFFRHESSRLVALLVNTFGFALVDVIEDMVQESMLQALRVWRLNGVPDNPTAWLHRVAKNRVIDSLRRNRKQVDGDLDFVVIGDRRLSFEADEIQDSVLRMIFTCCHPSLDRAYQLALTLKLVCGLGDHEIARGLLISSEAAKKRVTRAKRSLQLNRVSLDLPSEALIHERLDAVHDVLYLMFNEGYSASSGACPLNIDLCEEAARLCHLLCESGTGTPTTRALLALMLYHAARFESRMTTEQAVVLLADQDRRLWDRDMISVADYWMTRSATGEELSRFHIEAGIARLHCHAKSFEATDWQAILHHYDRLLEVFPSPIYRLNRAVTLGQLGRTAEALESLTCENENALSNYPLFYCVLADLHVQNGQPKRALDYLNLAFDLVRTEYEKRIIQSRMTSIQENQESTGELCN